MEEGHETQAGAAENLAGQGKPPLPELNEARVVGRVVNQPKVRSGSGATGEYKMARFILAVNRSYRDGSGKSIKETAFVPVVVWRALAAHCEVVGKGTAMRVEGRIKTWQVEGKNYRWELQGELLEIIDLRPAAGPTPEKQEELLQN